MLSDDFDVVGVATGGAEALEAVSEAKPDVIVLDVDMPGLTGFQTLREFGRAGLPRTPVVFLSMHDADEMVAEAFRCGGRGYVVKSHIGRDLASAIDQARLGRLFVPSLSTLFELTNGGGHALQLHRGPESFLDGIAAFFDLALRRGDAACMIASQRLREGLEARLRRRGWDVGGAFGHRRYQAIDVAEVLNRFMRNGLPDRDRLAEIVEELDQYRVAVAEGAMPRLTIFGAVATVLSADGNGEAAIALESLWNMLTHGRPFFTLCGYETSCFKSGPPDLSSRVCAEHGALSHAGD